MTPLPLSAAFVERLGWVLVHSIWQLACIALAALALQHTIATATYSFQDWWLWTEQRLRPWLNALVIAWCAGVLLFAVRPILSWYRVRRLRTVAVSAPPDAVQQVLRRTAERLHLRQAVQ